MAIVVVLVGQCGNQFGDELLTQLAFCTGHASKHTPACKGTGTSASEAATVSTSPSSSPPALSPFFTRDGLARCVLVDTEPKVVLGVRQRHVDVIRAENVVHGQSGRGNNWGLGYHGVKTAHSRHNEDNATVQRAFRNIARDQREEDDNVLGKALQAIYRETRRTRDADDGSGGFEALIIIHSLVGGTGSGLASRLTERLRLYFTEPPPGQQVDEVYVSTMMQIDGFDGGLYGVQRRARHLVNIAVAPQVVGEVATQGLNASLTLRILQQQSDAILLMRNDDAMTPGEAKGGSVCAGNSILSRCVTFKEANEVLVALLLPILGYGVESGCIRHVLMQCIPPAYVHTTGGNKILTLLPTPQRSYAVLRQCVHRALFYEIEGGRAFMPGYKPTVPIEQMLSTTAQQLWGNQPHITSKVVSAKNVTRASAKASAPKSKPNHTSTNMRTIGPQRAQQKTTSSASLSYGEATLPTQLMRLQDDDSIRGTNVISYRDEDPYEAQRRLSGRQRQRLGFRTGDDGGLSRPLPSSAGSTHASSSSSRRRPPVTPFSSAPANSHPQVQRRRQKQPAPACVPTRRGDYPQEEYQDYDLEDAYIGNKEPERRFDDDMREDGNEDDLNRRVFQQCCTKIPLPLYRHYQSLRRAPVTKMFETIDGVLLMNEALELDRKVLFPLLRSAALKVSTGAFMSSYEDVGVTSEQVKRAIRDVAEIMANSEEL